jgi:HK97 gp10 family phage protein
MAGVRVEVDTSWVSRLGPLSDVMVRRLCEDIAVDARRLAPVLTGDLRNSIDVLGVVDGVGRVGAGDARVDYAAYVELGTRRAPAQPYLRPAALRRRTL